MNKFVLGSMVLAASLLIGCGGDSACCDAQNLTESGMTPPVAKITGLNDTNVSIGQSLQAEGLASYDRDEGGSVVGFTWKVNGKVYSNGRNPTFTFKDPGIYRVCLTVTDNDGLDSVNEECRTIEVLGRSDILALAPTAVINLSNVEPDGTLKPCSIDHKKHRFDCNASHDNDMLGTGNEIRTCMWDVKSYKLDEDGNEIFYRDCTKIAEENPNGEFCVCDAATKIVARLTVVDNDGQSATTTKVYRVVK